MRRLFDRTPAEAAVILRALKAVATANGSLPMGDIHRATLQGLCDHILRVNVDLDAIGNRLQGDLERSIVDHEVRANLVHVALAIPFVAPEHEIERSLVVHEIATRFGIRERQVRDAEKAACGHYARMALDTTRGTLSELTGVSLAHSMTLYLNGYLHRDGDPALLARVQAFTKHPQHTVGRALLDYWRDNEFGVPGERGSVQSQVFMKHDVHHVLSGYDTTPRGEFAVAGFYTGLGDNDFADFTAMLLLQLQVAVQVDPTIAAWRDQFEPEVYFAAIERAEHCVTNVTAADWDPWSVVEQPLAEVRRQFGISEEGAMVCSPGDRWCGGLGPPGKRVSESKVHEARVGA